MPATADEVRLAARRLVGQAESDEARVTQLMTRAVTAAGATLVGLDDRVKSVQSVERKLRDVLMHDPRLSLDDAADSAHDVLRYSVATESETYASARTAVLAELRHNGVEVVDEINRWAGPGYRGINVRLRAGGGGPFEVQFHTWASLEASHATRGLYEELRRGSTSAARRGELVRAIDDIYARVPVPPGTLR
jgi:hypothetical protein